MFPMLVYDLVYLHLVKCSCMSRWLAWLLLGWCSHSYCDVIDLVMAFYHGSRVLSVGSRVCSEPRVPVIVSCFGCFALVPLSCLD